MYYPSELRLITVRKKNFFSGHDYWTKDFFWVKLRIIPEINNLLQASIFTDYKALIFFSWRDIQSPTIHPSSGFDWKKAPNSFKFIKNLSQKMSELSQEQIKILEQTRQLLIHLTESLHSFHRDLQGPQVPQWQVFFPSDENFVLVESTKSKTKSPKGPQSHLTAPSSPSTSKLTTNTYPRMHPSSAVYPSTLFPRFLVKHKKSSLAKSFAKNWILK